MCFLVPRCVHTPKDRLFGLEVCKMNLFPAQRSASG